jgi:hypothetical protein
MVTTVTDGSRTSDATREIREDLHNETGGPGRLLFVGQRLGFHLHDHRRVLHLARRDAHGGAVNLERSAVSPADLHIAPHRPGLRR